VATYRLQGLRKYNTLPYTGGCSITSLTTALSLGWAATAGVAFLLIFAFSLCSSLSQELSQRPYFSPSSGSDVSFLALPGLISLISAFISLIVGLSLVSTVACRTFDIPGVGCNFAGTCCNRIKIHVQFEGGDEPLLKVEEELPSLNHPLVFKAPAKSSNHVSGRSVIN